jgi:hypothetical protein
VRPPNLLTGRMCENKARRARIDGLAGRRVREALSMLLAGIHRGPSEAVRNKRRNNGLLERRTHPPGETSVDGGNLPAGVSTRVLGSRSPRGVALDPRGPLYAPKNEHLLQRGTLVIVFVSMLYMLHL